MADTAVPATQAGPGLGIEPEQSVDSPKRASEAARLAQLSYLELAPVTVTVYHNDARRIGAA